MYSVPTIVINSFAALGLVLGIPVVCRFLVFVWIYFLRPSSVKRYLTGLAPYALITGATDGIGKAVAKELYRKGFNLILHGRNDDKLRKVVAEIKASGGGRDIRYFLADATLPGHNFREMLQEFEDLNITLLINNVGGSTIRTSRIDEWSDEEVYGSIRCNALFPLGITRALLPQLRKSPGPVLVISMGSYAGDIPPPRVTTYAASKRFIEFLSRGLAMDELYFAATNVRFMYLCVGQVSTKALPKETSLLCPDADTFAKAVVSRIGCGRHRLAPYIWHAVSQWAVESLGTTVAEKIIAETMRMLFFAEKGTKID